MRVSSSAMPSGGSTRSTAAGGDRAGRHAVVLGRAVLGEGDAALAFDRPQAEGAVRGGARKNDADGIAPRSAASERKKVSMVVFTGRGVHPGR